MARVQTSRFFFISLLSATLCIIFLTCTSSNGPGPSTGTGTDTGPPGRPSRIDLVAGEFATGTTSRVQKYDGEVQIDATASPYRMGWAKFDLSGIDSGESLKTLTLHYYVKEVTNPAGSRCFLVTWDMQTLDLPPASFGGNYIDYTITGTGWYTVYFTAAKLGEANTQVATGAGSISTHIVHG